MDLARFDFLASKNFARSCIFHARKASFYLQEDNILQDFSKLCASLARKLLARSGFILQDGFYWESCKLGLDVIGRPITVLWQLLNEPRPLLSVVIEDLFSVSCSQDLMIVYGGTSLRILMDYVSLVVAPPLMLMIWLLILWRSYHYLLILILVHLLFRRSYLKFHIKSLGE